ncbi:MAG: amino acid ABC transporter substrate-binding protein [Acidimicrobiales bacterium]
MKVGASVSLSGDFSATGKTTKEGYQVWAAWQNAHGGILGKKVQMTFLSDGSSPTQVVTNYQKLITVNHVTFVVGPYSTLLTKPASVVANRYNKALVEGIGGGPSVFAQGLNNVFDVSAASVSQMVSFSRWVPTVYKPQKVAFAAITTPFGDPMVTAVRKYLTKKGFTVTKLDIYPLETTDFSPIASTIEASGAKIVVLGTQPPDGYALIQDFAQAHYTVTVVIEASGPDQGGSFVKAVGNNAAGVMYPSTWFPGSSGFHSKTMVSIAQKMFHIAKAGTVSANVAEAFSAGQVLAQAVNHIKSTTNKKLIAYMHSKGAKFQSVQGPVCFTKLGMNPCAEPYVFQWQHGKPVGVLPATKPDVVKVVNPKPKWGSST